MYAVIRTGGKQYRVAEGDRIDIEKLDAQVGDKVSFDEVLLVDDGNATQIGTPLLDSVSVAGEVVFQGRGEKLIIFKYKPRKGYRRRTGHRQSLTGVSITDIKLGAAKKKKAAPEEKVAKEAAPKVEAKAASEKAPKKKAAPKTEKATTASETTETTGDE